MHLFACCQSPAALCGAFIAVEVSSQQPDVPGLHLALTPH